MTTLFQSAAQSQLLTHAGFDCVTELVFIKVSKWCVRREFLACTLTEKFQKVSDPWTIPRSSIHITSPNLQGEPARNWSCNRQKSSARNVGRSQRSQSGRAVSCSLRELHYDRLSSGLVLVLKKAQPRLVQAHTRADSPGVRIGALGIILPTFAGWVLIEGMYVLRGVSCSLRGTTAVGDDFGECWSRGTTRTSRSSGEKMVTVKKNLVTHGKIPTSCCVLKGGATKDVFGTVCALIY